MPLIDAAEEIASHLRLAQDVGPFSTAHGPLLIILEHEITPLLRNLENQIRACHDGGAADLVLSAAEPVPIAEVPPLGKEERFAERSRDLHGRFN